MSSLLRTRLMEDLRIRNYSERTVEVYVRCVAEFAKYFGRSPEVLSEGHIREYQRYLVEEKKASWTFFNQTVCALRFLYRRTLGKEWLVEHTARFASLGRMWDDRARLWLIVRRRDVVEHHRAGERFLVVGRPGVDGIELGYRHNREGFWAYHPTANEYQFLATDLSSFLHAWQSGAITL